MSAAAAAVLALLATAAADLDTTCGDSCVVASDPVLLQLQAVQQRFRRSDEELGATDQWFGPIDANKVMPGSKLAQPASYGKIFTTRAPRAIDHMIFDPVAKQWKWQWSYNVAPGESVANALNGQPLTPENIEALRLDKRWQDKDAGDVTDPETLRKLIAKNKIKRVVFFIEDEEMAQIKSTVLEQFYLASMNVPTVQRIPFADFTAPDFAKLQQAVDLISVPLTKGENVLLHCMGGTGRTGTMVVAALMGLNAPFAEDTTGLKQAIKFAQTEGKPTYIETNSQCAALVARWPTAPGCPQMTEDQFSCHPNMPHCLVNADNSWPCNDACWGSAVAQPKCALFKGR